jgi:hypothetical protein
MKTTSIGITLLLLCSLLLQACGNAQTAIQTGVAATQQIAELQTQAAGAQSSGTEDQEAQEPQQAEEPSQEEEEAAPQEPTETPTVTQTPTPDVAQITVRENTNCRTGPAKYYGHVTTVNDGQTAEVVGLPVDNVEYVIIKNPNGSGTCWLWLQYADKDRSDFAAYNLQKYQTPATPTPSATATPEFSWAGTWTVFIDGTPGVSATFSVSGNSVTSSFAYLGETVTINGTISNNGQNLSGTYVTTAPSNGSIQFQIKSGNRNQFVGNYDGGGGEWCGARSGASKPSPCQGP